MAMMDSDQHVVIGDCLTVPMPATPPALVYADPPFGSGVTRQGKACGYDDHLTGEAYIDWLLPRLCRWADTIETGWLCLHHDPLVGIDVAAALQPHYGKPYGIVAWQDAWVSGFRSRAASFWPRVHDTLTFWKFGDAPFFPTVEAAPSDYKRRGGGGGTERSLGDLWVGPWSPGHLSFSKEKVGWPDQKPLALLGRVIEATTRPGQLVVDPFCGSGTTVVAALMQGRDAVGVEANPVAFGLAQERVAMLHIGSPTDQPDDAPYRQS